MKILADTRQELEEIIEMHAADGWIVVERHHAPYSFTATLKRKEPNDQPKTVSDESDK